MLVIYWPVIGTRRRLNIGLRDAARNATNHLDLGQSIRPCV